MSKTLEIRNLGHLDYARTWQLQKDIQARVIAGEQPDILLLVEHEPVYTLGKNANTDHILGAAPKHIKTFRIERGGDVTYHGPGQLVGYPILDLNHYRRSISWYMRTLEGVVIQTLSAFGITGERKEGLTGVWVDDEKIAALGVRISRWVTMHGFALNVDPNLDDYGGIIPCGIFEYGVTSMARVLDRPVTLEEVIPVLSEIFRRTFIMKEI